MNTIEKRLVVPVIVSGILMLAACQQTQAPGSEDSVLRVHDVSGMQVDELDDKLNDLLSREDLPLRGRVELLDDNRLAVNASRNLQNEIAALIDQLRDNESANAVDRPFRVQYWFLRMARGEGSSDVPDSIATELAPLVKQFPGYSLSVEDYLETYHTPASRVGGNVSSGKGARVSVRSTESTEEGVMLRAQIYSPGQNSSIMYDVNHTIVPGKPFVLGQVHDGSEAAQASYQVLVARAEWTDTSG